MPAAHPTYPEKEDGVAYSWEETEDVINIDGADVTVLTRRGKHPNKPPITTMMAFGDYNSRTYTVVGDEEQARRTVARRAVNGDDAPLRERLLTPKHIPTSEPRTYEDEYSLSPAGALFGLLGGVIAMGGVQIGMLVDGILRAVVIGTSFLIAIPLMILTGYIVLTPILRFLRDTFWYTRHVA